MNTMQRRTGKLMKVVFILSASAYNFQDKNSDKKIQGMTLLVTDGCINNKQDQGGIVIEKYSLNLEIASQLGNIFQNVPKPYVVQLAQVGQKMKIIQIFDIQSILDIYQKNPSLKQEQNNSKDKDEGGQQ